MSDVRRILNSPVVIGVGTLFPDVEISWNSASNSFNCVTKFGYKYSKIGLFWLNIKVILGMFIKANPIMAQNRTEYSYLKEYAF